MDVVRARKVKYFAYMAKAASLTVRISDALKKQIEARAERERRSVSAQVEHELARALGSRLTKQGT